MFSLQIYGLVGMGVLCAVTATSCGVYKRKADALDFALSTQNAAIEAQNKQASERLAVLTTERDELQGSLNKAANTAKDKQNAFDKALDDLRDRPAEPVRLRIASCDAGRSSGSSDASVSSPAQVGSGAQATGTGLLAPAAARQFERTLIEVEELSRDFNSCQDSLLARVASERKR